jgi:hypothetical protein
MPSRKQRRRRTKDRRHDYEYVYVDDEGNEVDADDIPEPSRNGAARGRAAAKPDAPIRVAGGRVVKPPSWQRAVRRGFLFAPAMFGILFLLNRGKLPVAGLVLNTLILLAFFIPFGFLMDKMMYRTYLRRQTAGKAKPKPKPKTR